MKRSDPVLVIDVGSTFTKAALVDRVTGAVLARGDTPTTTGTDVMHGLRALQHELGADDVPVLACSSAGGGLRLAVVGYERVVTAEAGQRVGLSAGAKVVHVASGRLDTPSLAELVSSSPDIVLLVGGTDGGNADVLCHNATRLAHSRLPTSVPVVVAGNVDGRHECAAVLAAAGRPRILADNVLPRIGVVAPESARAAIRAAFIRHVIGGKGLSSDPAFAQLVRAATPDAVLRGVEVLADVLGGDVLVIDIGGATTDVYSSVADADEQAGRHREVVAALRHARTVEADLGMRWNADGIVTAAHREHLPISSGLRGYAARMVSDPAYLPGQEHEVALDLELARLAAVVAVRRHARPPHPGEPGRPLTDVHHVVGSGGVLRHAAPEAGTAVLGAVVTDRAGGWKLPRHTAADVDRDYLLFVVGLLAEAGHDRGARAVARRMLPG
jgi:uncharacterized protein (TIGR01319 family)